MPRLRSHGFTLVELLVVIAIMVVLMSLVFPIAKSALESADRSACMSNLHLIGQGVLAYQQDYFAFPSAPNYVGVGGVPQGGVTGLAITNPNIVASTFWCSKDPFPTQLSAKDVKDKDIQGLLRDDTNSTYNFGYNYYGLVTTSDGLPFPITSREAAVYFLGKPEKCDPVHYAPSPPDATSVSLKDPEWDLGLLRPDADLYVQDNRRTGALRYWKSSITSSEVSLSGLFQGLVNTRAPRDTVITFCPHHPTNLPKHLPVILLGGEATLVKPIRPRIDNMDFLVPRSLPQRHLTQAIDWRIHKAPLPQRPQFAQEHYGDSLRERMAQNMPLVELFYRRFTPAQMGTDAFGYRWYDTGIDIQAHDVLMFVATAKWCFGPNVRGASLFSWFADEPAYAMLFDSSGRLQMTPDGDPVDRRGLLVNPDKYDGLQMLLPSVVTDTTVQAYPHSLLVGSAGGIAGNAALEEDRRAAVFPIGSRGWYLVPEEQVPLTETRPLLLSQNDTLGNFTDNTGWCEVWIALYRPEP
jgi:prepilin-type N-terminal cleavage/methylation domain-containing protein